MIAASVILQLFSYSVLLPTKSLTKINIDFVYKMCTFFRVSDIGLGHLKGSITKFSGNTRNNGRESEGTVSPTEGLSKSLLEDPGGGAIRDSLTLAARKLKAKTFQNCLKYFLYY